MSGRTAIVTGGTTGLGAAAAKLFRKEGATVVATGLNPETIARARDELAGVEIVRADAADPNAAREFVARVHEQHGNIDIVLANAGVSLFASVEQSDEQLFEKLFGINVRGPFFTVQAALPYMVSGASIIFTSSVSASLGVPGQALYAATKAAVRSLSRTMAAELGPRGIRVNTISPGAIETPGWGKTGAPIEMVRRAVEEGVQARVPLRRAGQPDEFAALALFLASSQSSYMTGADLPVDGGLTNV